MQRDDCPNLTPKKQPSYYKLENVVTMSQYIRSSAAVFVFGILIQSIFLRLQNFFFVPTELDKVSVRSDLLLIRISSLGGRVFSLSGIDS